MEAEIDCTVVELRLSQLSHPRRDLQSRYSSLRQKGAMLAGYRPDPLQPHLVRQLKSASEEGPWGSSLHHSVMEGQRAALHLPLTSVLPFNDGWHLRESNRTV